MTHLDGLHADPEKSFQNSLSTFTSPPCTMEASRSRQRDSVWGELTPRTQRAQIRSQSRSSSALWAWVLCGQRAWQCATSLRQRSTYRLLSPLRCSARSWCSATSRGTSSWLGTIDGYLQVSTEAICNLKIETFQSVQCPVGMLLFKTWTTLWNTYQGMTLKSS